MRSDPQPRRSAAAADSSPADVAPGALTLPAVAAMDASVWEVNGGWSLTNAASEDGTSLGWLAANSPDPALLSWTQSVDLSGAHYPTLSLRTALQGDQASAVVQVAGNNGVWNLLTVIPAGGWQTVSADLSAYAGQTIQLRFAWLAAPVEGEQSWKLAQVVVADIPPTLTAHTRLQRCPPKRQRQLRKRRPS